jgi:hypothetical protein
MPQNYLDASPTGGLTYQTNFSPVLAYWMPPYCPAALDGSTQVFDLENKRCTSLPRDAFSSAQLARSSGACAGAGPFGGVFMKDINGKCYKTNDCPVSPDVTQFCVAGQNIPVRKNPLSGPGVLANTTYGGQTQDYLYDNSGGDILNDEY